MSPNTSALRYTTKPLLLPRIAYRTGSREHKLLAGKGSQLLELTEIWMEELFQKRVLVLLRASEREERYVFR